VKFIDKNRIFLVILLFSVSLISSSVYFLANSVDSNDVANSKEDGTPYIPPEPDPIVDFIDYENGTTKTTIDYQNGITDVFIETKLIKRSTLELDENIVDQELEIELPTSTELATEWVPATMEVEMGQQFLMGFTYEFKASRTVINLEYNIIVHRAYFRAGYHVDIGFGVRLPIKIELLYPEQMTVGHDYEIYATLTALNWPNFNEFKCTFQAYLWVEVGQWWPFVGWSKYRYNFGPDYDYSKSFKTPVGPGDSFPIPEIEIPLWNLWLMVVKLVISPELGSDKITAKKVVTGDARLKQPQSSTIRWYDEGTIMFKVHADDYSSSNYAYITLTDFRYYFSRFFLHFDLKFDITDWIDWLTGDPRFRIFTVDMSWLTDGLYLKVHQGYDPTMDVRLFVEKYGVDLYLYPKNRKIDAGQQGIYYIRVKNTGNTRDTFRLEVDDSLSPQNTYVLSTDSVTLNPNQHAWVSLIVTQGYTTPGNYYFDVYAYSAGSDETNWDKERGRVQLEPSWGVDVMVTPTTAFAKPGETVEYDIELINLGNVEDSFDISLNFISLDEQWTSIDKTFMILGPGESDIAKLTVTVPSDWAGMQTATYQFTATGTSTTHPTESDSETADLAVLPTKESKARYIDIELESLNQTISDSMIDEDVKTGLTDKLTAAIEKKEQALDYIIEGKMKLANNMLGACKNLMEAYLNLVDAQFGKAIPEHTAYDWKHWGEIIIGYIDEAIATAE
jgi:uncharacterized repeat protein (TIGR01451 family)